MRQALQCLYVKSCMYVRIRVMLLSFQCQLCSQQPADAMAGQREELKPGFKSSLCVLQPLITLFPLLSKFKHSCFPFAQSRITMAARHDTTRRRHAMILRSSRKPKPPRWTALPAEIRLLILEAIVQQKHPRWASSAAVCKEWQRVIERENFYQLELHVPCVDDFERITLWRQQLVHHISLDIELPRYTCRSCDSFESETWQRRNSSIVSKGIWKLFSILSGWTAAAKQKGLALELSAHSPSDSDHWFKHYRFTSGRGGDGEDGAVSGGDVGSGLLDDPKHGWRDARQETPPPRMAVLRLFTAINLRFPAKLPQVDAVTRFTIRRQLRRRLDPIELQLLFRKLGRLEHMVYEPWRVWRRLDAELRDRGTYPSERTDGRSIPG